MYFGIVEYNCPWISQNPATMRMRHMNRPFLMTWRRRAGNFAEALAGALGIEVSVKEQHENQRDEGHRGGHTG